MFSPYAYHYAKESQELKYYATKIKMLFYRYRFGATRVLRRRRKIVGRTDRHVQLKTSLEFRIHREVGKVPYNEDFAVWPSMCHHAVSLGP